MPIREWMAVHFSSGRGLSALCAYLRSEGISYWLTGSKVVVVLSSDWRSIRRRSEPLKRYKYRLLPVLSPSEFSPEARERFISHRLPSKEQVHANMRRRLEKIHRQEQRA